MATQLEERPAVDKLQLAWLIGVLVLAGVMFIAGVLG